MGSVFILVPIHYCVYCIKVLCIPWWWRQRPLYTMCTGVCSLLDVLLVICECRRSNPCLKLKVVPAPAQFVNSYVSCDVLHCVMGRELYSLPLLYYACFVLNNLRTNVSYLTRNLLWWTPSSLGIICPRIMLVTTWCFLFYVNYNHTFDNIMYS